MPSTTSIEVSIPFASSTVTTPSLPTRSIASATKSPSTASLCAEIVATCAFSFRLATGFESPRIVATAAFSPRSRPRLMSTALAPAARFLRPSEKIAWARSVDVVVPSPTTSAVRSAASRSMCAPRFSSGSSRSISLTIVTPSLQTSGGPHAFSMSTHLLFGPSVTRTASARIVAPRSTRSRASDRKRIRLWAMAGLRERCGSPAGKTNYRTPPVKRTEAAESAAMASPQ